MTIQYISAVVTQHTKSNVLLYLVTFGYILFVNINQLDALNFIISLFQASTCFEHMCSSSGGQIVLYSLWYHHTYRWPSRAPDDHL